MRPDVDYAVVRDGEQRLIVAEALRERARREGRPRAPGRAAAVAARSSSAGATRRPSTGSPRGSRPRLLARRRRPTSSSSTPAPASCTSRPPSARSTSSCCGASSRRARTCPCCARCGRTAASTRTSRRAAYAGRWVKDCDRDLVRELKERGLLWHAEQIRHEYPFCVRSDDDPLIQYARPAWYIRTTAHVDEALANNAAIQWLPEHIRDGRFGDFLRNNVDWALSRERFWGTPLNIWINDETGAIDAPASVAEILERNPRAFDAFDAARAADPDALAAPARPQAVDRRGHLDAARRARRLPPRARGDRRLVRLGLDALRAVGLPAHAAARSSSAAFPADFISEAIDQTRGWFNSLLWVSTLLFPERGLPHPYKTCIVLGHVADRDGKKESKSKGNYTPPEIILDRVRLEFAAVSPRRATPPAPGRAVVAREDYEGLDLRGELAKVRVYRDDAPEAALELELRPGRLPRRVIELAEADARGARRRASRRRAATRCRARCPDLPAREQALGRGPELARAGRRRLPLVLLLLESAVESDAPLAARRAHAAARAAAQAAQRLRVLHASTRTSTASTRATAACRAGRRPVGAARRRSTAGSSRSSHSPRARDAAHGRLPPLRGDGRADRLRRRALELVRAAQSRPLLGARARRPTSSTCTGRSTSAWSRSRGCSRPSCPSRPRRCGRTWCAARSPDASEASVHFCDYPAARRGGDRRRALARDGRGARARLARAAGAHREQAARAPAARGRGDRARRSRARGRRCASTST